MPNYDYRCEQCGPFTERVAMASCDDPQPCPSCGNDAPRAILRAPNMGGVGGGGAPVAHVHTGGCGCGHTHH